MKSHLKFHVKAVSQIVLAIGALSLTEILSNIPALGSTPKIGDTLIGIGVGSKSGTKLVGFENTLSEVFKKRADFILTERNSSTFSMQPATIGVTQCSGDSGGAILTTDTSGALKLIGIITAHNDTFCGAKELIAYGENVEVWIDWIEKETAIRLQKT